jgi:isoquinoline 1-oxidoreductase alpha subunit
MIQLVVNGRRHKVEVEPDTPLLWVLREQLQLTGTKYGCGVGVCGACTVHIDGRAVRSCLIPVSSVQRMRVVTIEGVASGELHPVQSAWIEHQVPQCGYCQSGQIMAAIALLNRGKAPTDEDIDQAMSNICRCGTYHRIRRAIHAAAKSMVK